ncbi:LacI family DNA-binding transcriptional regulator [Loktanella sp. M215]|uniref:LacI family DNA-binding transcriptional regulator n=1 Tax=Loktanella sp. M215 TaxID=2675431 RepID=UPI001F1DA661|nr:LacI family DNA-binding transcriptional regulator [Loktanella sp. M215]MCF7698438.1 substrate-binding domain-containing protein [Loktanella sp. M215]
MDRPTIHDVAREAQVSLATVDRVLNNRGGVAAKSVEKVHFAVEKTGYVRDQFAANLSRGRGYRFTFLLPAGQSSFVRHLIAAIDTESARYRKDRVLVDVRSSKTFDPAAQVAALRRIDPAQTDCAAVMVTDVPAVRAELARLRAAGVRILALVSDVGGDSRDIYVGPDNETAGRMAGSFMGRFMRKPSGPVLVIAGSLAARDHAQRLLGFRQVLQAEFPALTVLPVAEGFDDAGRIAAIAGQAMADAPLMGIYAIGAGNAGLVTALSQANSVFRPVTILHELTETTRAGLRADLFDLVIDQDPARAITRAMSIMRDLADGQPVGPDRGDIPLNIFIKENVQ